MWRISTPSRSIASSPTLTCCSALPSSSARSSRRSASTRRLRRRRVSGAGSTLLSPSASSTSVTRSARTRWTRCSRPTRSRRLVSRSRSARTSGSMVTRSLSTLFPSLLLLLHLFRLLFALTTRAASTSAALTGPCTCWAPLQSGPMTTPTFPLT